jgi:hypothetical protein
MRLVERRNPEAAKLIGRLLDDVLADLVPPTSGE